MDAPPSCATIEAFAEAAFDVGITYDIQSSASPAELTSRSHAVVAGQLTDAFRSTVVGRRDFVGYEIAPTEVIKGSDDHEVGTPLIAWVEIGALRPPADFEEATQEGIPVVVFGFKIEDLDGLVVQAVEGMATGCPGMPPIGWLGASGSWVDLPSLEALEEAASQAPPAAG